MVVNQLQYFPFLHPHFCVVHLCAHVKTQHLLYNLYCMSPLWQAGYSLVFLPGLNWNWSNLFLPHLCQYVGSTDCAAHVQWHSSLWSGPVYFMQIWQAQSKLTNEGQAKWPAKSNYPCPPVLGLQDRATMQLPRIVWAAGIEPGLPACRAAMLPKT